MNNRRGYSLIEMAVVLVVISILTGLVAAASIVLFDDTETRESESNAWLVLIAQQRYAQTNGSYTTNPDALGDVAGVGITTGPSDKPDIVSVAIGERGSLGLAVRRDGGRCVLLQAKALDAGGAVVRPTANSVTCHGQEALPGLEPEI